MVCYISAKETAKSCCPIDISHWLCRLICYQQIPLYGARPSLESLDQPVETLTRDTSAPGHRRLATFHFYAGTQSQGWGYHVELSVVCLGVETGPVDKI